MLLRTMELSESEQVRRKIGSFPIHIQLCNAGVPLEQSRWQGSDEIVIQIANRARIQGECWSRESHILAIEGNIRKIQQRVGPKQLFGEACEAVEGNAPV